MNELSENDHAKSVNEHGIMTRNISTVCNGANSGVNRMQFIFLALVPQSCYSPKQN